jgi:predicted RNA methylase
MVATPCDFKERYCQICRLDIYHDAQEAKNAEFLQRSAAAAKGEKIMATGRVFFTMPPMYEYVHVNTCKKFSSNHENAEDAGAEWLKIKDDLPNFLK